MSNVIAADQLRLLIERIERLTAEEEGLREDKKDVYLEAKATGFDPATMRQIVKMRKMASEKRQESESLLATYMAALGMQHSFDL